MTNSSKTAGLSRRSFLGLGALAAAGAAAAGMAGCAPSTPTSATDPALGETGAPAASDWLGSAPEIDAADIVETVDTDFLIIGAGTAGMCAAATASDLGLDFILAEKNDGVQETREYLGIVNSPAALAQGGEVDKAKLLNELTRYASGKCRQDVIKVWLDESAEMFEWMDGKMQATGKQVVVDMPTDHATGGTDYYLPVLQHVWLTPYEPPMRNDVLLEVVTAAGNTPRFGHTLERLIQDDDGTVTGALFSTKDGYVQVNAKDTLLATGGYAANPVMMSALQPAALSCCTAASYAPNCDGLGLRAGLWAGGVKDEDPAPMIFDRGAVAPGDANAPEDILRFSTIGCSAFANQMMAVGMPIEEFCTVALEQGVMQKADTLDELADKLGFEGEAKAAFLDQAERYNAQFDAQADDDFGKEAYRLSALRTAPFYGCWFGGSLLTTIDGLQINRDCQVLRADESVIPGLYAAGDVSGSFFSGNYPEYIVGCASGRSSTQGRHVARLLAGDLKA